MKRVLALVLSTVLILCSIPVLAYSHGEFKNGDVNKDNNLSIKDAALIQRSVAKLAELDETQERLADFALRPIGRV